MDRKPHGINFHHRHRGRLNRRLSGVLMNKTMQFNDEQLQLILVHLFKKENQRQFVKAVIENEVATVYQGEKRFNISPNTGWRQMRKFNAHIDYLSSLKL